MSRSYQQYSKRGPPHGAQSHRGATSHRDLQRTGSLPNSQVMPLQNQPLAPTFAEFEPSAGPPAPNNYDQVVRFLQDSYSKYTEEVKNPSKEDERVMYYTEVVPNPKLKDFVAVNLDEMCKRRRAAGPPPNFQGNS